MDSRWTCGPLAIGSSFYRFEDCDLDFSLNYYRYIRQIQLGEPHLAPTNFDKTPCPYGPPPRCSNCASGIYLTRVAQHRPPAKVEPSESNAAPIYEQPTLARHTTNHLYIIGKYQRDSKRHCAVFYLKGRSPKTRIGWPKSVRREGPDWRVLWCP